MKETDKQIDIDALIESIDLLDKKHFFHPSDGKWLSYIQQTRLLYEKSFLKHTIIFPTLNEFYIYENKMGFYVKCDEAAFKVCIGEVFLEIGLTVDYKHVTAICNNFKVGKKSKRQPIETEKKILCFRNCLLHLTTGEQEDHSPNYFITSRLEFDYDPTQQNTSNFDEYLDHLCDGHQDRKIFLRSWLRLLITNCKSTQTFLYVLGKAKTGKSVLGHLCTALVGKQGTVVTSLRALNNDPFEVYNLKDKLLIIISDTEFYKGDLSILKQVVSGDPLKARIKFIQGSNDIYPQGLVIIIGNYGFGSCDSSGAIERRLRLFIADKVIPAKETKPLLYNDKGSWYGLMGLELPAIFNWIYSWDLNEAIRYVEHTFELVPSMRNELTEGFHNLNPLKSWIEEEIQVGPGSYLGYQFKEDDKSLMEYQRRGLLYPAYYRFCKKQGLLPLSHRLFSREFLQTALEMSFKVRKTRLKEGVYIEGVQLKAEIFDRDRLYGGSIVSELDSVANPKDTIRSNEQTRLNIPTDIYTPYMALLDKTPLKASMNKWIRNNTPEIDSLVVEYFKDHQTIDPVYKAHIQKIFQKGIDTIKVYGAIPYKYKRMGVSPRIIPVNYGQSLNNTKRILRNQIYGILARSSLCKGYSIVDLDLKSCYTSILLGLYPGPLEAIQKAIEGKGLWKHIEDEFHQKGQGHLYNKKFVKICVYSSFFLGGTKAMLEGIMDSVREDVGLTKEDFRSSTLYETTYKTAQGITSEMMNSSIIIDFQTIANHIKKTYLNEYMEGPSGQQYKVTEINFRNVYPNWLQSYEITLLSVPLLEVVKEYPSVELIGHYHDGNVLLIPNDQVSRVLSLYQEKVTNLGFQLGLKYKQELEVKQIFDSSAT